LKRFKFSLESVLVVKQKLLEDERLELARAMACADKEKKILDDLFLTLEDIRKEYDETVGKRLDIALMINYDTYAKKLTNDIENQKEVLKQAHHALYKRQNKVKAAYIAVKTLEKLKEKQKEAYDKECLQEEFKLIDDIVSSRKMSA